MIRPLVLSAFGFALALACSAADPSSQVHSGGNSGKGGSQNSGGNLATGGASLGGSDSFGGSFTGGTQSQGGTFQDGGECFATSKTADNTIRPVDIIWALDTSCSMLEEAQGVQNNMNTFAGAILSQGIDVHVVMISEAGPPTPFGFPPKMGVCIPSPLGSGNCPFDTNLPRYGHLFEDIGSSDALVKLRDLYPQYKSMLRQNAVKYFAVVTDDNSMLPAQDFIDTVEQLDPGWFDIWKFFGVYCTTNCNACASVGTVYTELAQATGTSPGNLCLGQNGFAPVFTALAQTVVAGTKLDCQWQIPEAPEGEVFDPNAVNVNYTPSSGGGTEKVYYVNSLSECGPEGGWYYDNPANPKRILVCPNTCDQISSDLQGKVDILFGCQRIDVPK